MDQSSKDQLGRLNEAIESQENHERAQRGYEMGLTSDRSNPGLKNIKPNGQQETYLVLSADERAKGFVMPVYRSYVHLKCGQRTSMGLALCETYARNPKFYGGTFCCACGAHFPLTEYVDGKVRRTFIWEGGQAYVGEGPDEVEARLSEKQKGAGI
jgi:hypothetical protein